MHSLDLCVAGNFFRGSFEIEALKKNDLTPTPRTSSIPKTGCEWRSLMDSVLEDRNRYKVPLDDMLERVDDTVKAHCHEMEGHGLEVTDVVHCKCKLALYFLEQS